MVMRTGESYIASQVSQGWEMLPDRYDDGGISGGTTERPALQRLLEDVKSGKVNIVVVYKLDRLSRSMFDFLKMIEFFKQHDVTFVSVTQHISTDSAMGRLMLNVLQSFAQFEMEQTSERIRDKIAATKAKGMWVGGTVPIGYDVVDGRLELNSFEAETVHYIFKRYLELGAMKTLLQDLKDKGHKTKARVTKTGKHYPAKDYTKSSVYRILRNKIYVGKIEHKEKDKIYDGVHKAIIEQSLWDKVQALLDVNKSSRINNPKKFDHPYLLKGIIETLNGYAMTPTAQRKNNKSYRYYISTEALKKGAKKCPIRTMSAPIIEEIILDRVRMILTNPEWINRILSLNEDSIGKTDLKIVTSSFETVWANLFPVEQARIVHMLIEKIVVHPDRIIINFLPVGMVSILHEIKPDLGVQADDVTTETPFALEIPISIQKQGARKYIKAPDGKEIIKSRKPNFDNTLINALVRAYHWTENLDDHKVKSAHEIAAQEGVRYDYVQKTIRLANLAPDITEAILNGRQPQSLTLSQLENNTMPLLWAEQREVYGFTAH